MQRDTVPLKRLAIYAGGFAALVLVVVGVALFARRPAPPKPVLGGAQATAGAPELAAGEGSPVVTNPAPVGQSVPRTGEPAQRPVPAVSRAYAMPRASGAAAPVPAPSASAAGPEPSELPLPGGPVVTRPHGSAEPRPAQSPPAGDAQPAPPADSSRAAPAPRPDTASRPKPVPAEKPDTAAPARPRPDSTSRPSRPDPTAPR